MKIYVAGKFGEKQQVREVMQRLKTAGHEITYDWTNANVDPKTSADWDIGGVRKADAVLALFTDPDYAYRGTFTELGAALALQIPVHAVCPDANAMCWGNCFFHATGIHHYSSLDAAIDQLQIPKGQPRAQFGIVSHT